MTSRIDRFFRVYPPFVLANLPPLSLKWRLRFQENSIAPWEVGWRKRGFAGWILCSCEQFRVYLCLRLRVFSYASETWNKPNQLFLSRILAGNKLNCFSRFPLSLEHGARLVRSHNRSRLTIEPASSINIFIQVELGNAAEPSDSGRMWNILWTSELFIAKTVPAPSRLWSPWRSSEQNKIRKNRTSESRNLLFVVQLHYISISMLMLERKWLIQCNRFVYF